MNKYTNPKWRSQPRGRVSRLERTGVDLENNALNLCGLRHLVSNIFIETIMSKTGLRPKFLKQSINPRYKNGLLPHAFVIFNFEFKKGNLIKNKIIKKA
jgi:hypothetical protein